MMDGMEGHTLGMVLGLGWWWIIGLLFIGLALFLVYRTRGKARDPEEASARTPLDVLKDRYASGEIDKEEFERKKKELVE